MSKLFRRGSRVVLEVEVALPVLLAVVLEVALPVLLAVVLEMLPLNLPSLLPTPLYKDPHKAEPAVSHTAAPSPDSKTKLKLSIAWI